MSYKRTFIVAEAGVNHNGNIDLAKKMINVAVAAGAGESQLEMIKNLELDAPSHQILIDYCKKRTFGSSPPPLISKA